MARVTVEDCLDNVENRFQLVLVAARRARQLQAGAEPYVERENDKPTVLALREIAGGFVTSAILEESEHQVEAGLDVNEDLLRVLGAPSGEAKETESAGKEEPAPEQAPEPEQPKEGDADKAG